MNTENTSDTPSDYTVDSLTRAMRDRLSPRFGESETAWLLREIWRWLKGWDRTALLLHGDDRASVFVADSFERVVSRLLRGEPLQYITGEAWFYGMTFEVDPSTLIPRPETAELVDLIVDANRGRDDLRVLDVGTGSGCIAVALSRNLPFARVTGLDISADALAVARRNAARLKARVDFVEGDILSMPAPAKPLYDIIVSNPPYIAESERSSMEDNVLLHEPPTALFVPDSDPLRFYRAILRYAAAALGAGGQVWFEINPRYVGGLRDLAAGEDSWTDIDFRRDMQGKVRFMSLRRSVSPQTP
ncbi:MAG: peptide chain release factor N(5)-glutamine methyltransferase [Clostridium sp.]|nr:peptide chain release factor N(5)-glutamine methyltransferase [Clostridium sp.]